MVEDRASAEVFGRFAVELHDTGGVEETVEAVVQFALQAVWCDYASVVLIVGKQNPEIMALTDSKLARLYQEQIDAGEGPLRAADHGYPAGPDPADRGRGNRDALVSSLGRASPGRWDP